MELTWVKVYRFKPRLLYVDDKQNEDNFSICEQLRTKVDRLFFS